MDPRNSLIQVEIGLEAKQLLLPISFHPAPTPNPGNQQPEWRVDDDAVIKLQVWFRALFSDPSSVLCSVCLVAAHCFGLMVRPDRDDVMC